MRRTVRLNPLDARLHLALFRGESTELESTEDALEQ